MRKIRWCQQDIEKLKELYALKNARELEAIFNRKSCYINMKAKSLGLKKIKNLYNFNNVKILNEESLISAYWLGYLMADGHFTNKRISVSAAAKDENHLNLLAHYINVSLQKRKVKSNFGVFETVSLAAMDSIHVPLIVEKFNISTNKTLNPPSIDLFLLNEKYFMSFVIGFIDGDGSITKLNRKASPFNIKIKIHKNWLNNLNFISNFISKFFQISSKMKASINATGYASLTVSNNKIILKMRNFAIENELPILIRKWDQIEI